MVEGRRCMFDILVCTWTSINTVGWIEKKIIERDEHPKKKKE